MPYRLELRQHFTLMVNRWDLTRTAPDAAQLGFIEQKRMSLKEKVTCWDPSRTGVVFTVQANEAHSALLRWEVKGELAPGQSGLIKFQARVRF